MPINFNDTGPKQRWVPFDGHLAGIEILVQFYGTEERQKFANYLESKGITRVTKDNPLKINPGRERAFFLEIAKRYVRDWRVAEGFPPETMQPEGAVYDDIKMGGVLADYPRAFEILMSAVENENAFFVTGANGSMPS